jgi:predicted ATPase/DNA-binding CsgD family transcriptional regulator
LEIRETGDLPAWRRIGVALRDRRLLLVLDNVEQVIEAAAEIAELLAACPDLAILVTSRTRLRFSGEHEFAVRPLPIDDNGDTGSIGDGSLAPAIRLFVERAQALKRDFALTESDGPIVADICRRLDGPPLAIELAAARIKVLTPVALLARLDRRLPVLTGGGRDLPARQQTMRDAIAWSYDLLTADEQRMCRRLAIFVDGFTLDAAVAFLGEDAIGVLDGITSLVDSSLVRADVGANGEPRYRMLETVREFGREQLDACDETEATGDQHAAYYLALAEDRSPNVPVPGDERWLSRIVPELANVRLALSWFDQRGAGRSAARRRRGDPGEAWRSGLPRRDRPVHDRSLVELAALGYGSRTDTQAAGRSLTIERVVDEAWAVARDVPGSEAPARQPTLGNLTRREREVLRLLVTGKTDREIGDVFFLSRRTVTTHTTNLMAKLGVSSRTEAAVRAVRDGLI